MEGRRVSLEWVAQGLKDPAWVAELKESAHAHLTPHWRDIVLGLVQEATKGETVTIHDSAGFPLYTIPPDGEIDPMDDYDLSSGGK